jgi:co-chaperonin GroES (HSP10)
MTKLSDLSPTRDKVLVKVIRPEQLMSEGMLLPDTFRSQLSSQQGRVLSVGEGMDFLEGVMVLFPAGHPTMLFDNTEIAFIDKANVISELRD